MSRWQEKIVDKNTDVFVGIDVSKAKLDVCILPHGLVSQVDNTAKAIRELAREFKKRGVQLIAMEATGKYHRLAQANAKEIASLAGVAPMNWDSGTKFGKRIIRGGRRSVRNALYMCAVSAVSRPDPFGKTYRHLINRGKNPKVALTAVMRKLVIVANTLIAEDRKWQPIARDNTAALSS